MKKYLFLAIALIVTLAACGAPGIAARAQQAATPTTVTQTVVQTQTEVSTPDPVTVTKTSTKTKTVEASSPPCAQALEKAEDMMTTLLDVADLYNQAVQQAALGLLVDATNNVDAVTDKLDQVNDVDFPRYAALRAACMAG